MLKPLLVTAITILGITGPVMAQQRIRISCEWGEVTAALTDNVAAKSLARMLPLTIEMRDHLRQEKTGALPSSLAMARRQYTFSAGTLGLRGEADFVIYYKNGQVPLPGVVLLGKIDGDVSIFNRPGSVKVYVQRTN